MLVAAQLRHTATTAKLLHLIHSILPNVPLRPLKMRHTLVPPLTTKGATAGNKIYTRRTTNKPKKEPGRQNLRHAARTTLRKPRHPTTTALPSNQKALEHCPKHEEPCSLTHT